jgi:pimeloyl-ACP methyl ester carboxylesterase
VDGFRLAYDRAGEGPAVVALHGWPGARSDHRALRAALGEAADVVVPDLRGFGDSEGPDDAPVEAYAAAGQAASVLALIGELGLERPVIVGYDVGSRVAQALAARAPDVVGALVIAPPLPGAGMRVLAPEAQREFWYQAFHQLELAERLIDGRPEAVRAYLEHFWSHWSAPDWTPPAALLDELTTSYARPGAFVRSLAWYRAGSGTVAQSVAERPPDPAERIAVPTTVLWPELDPLFPVAWSDRVGEFFADAQLRVLAGAGHFSPLEATGEMAAAVRERLGSEPRPPAR